MDSRSAQRFWKLTGGNALFLRQLLKDQIAAGRMQAGGRGVDVGRGRRRVTRTSATWWAASWAC